MNIDEPTPEMKAWHQRAKLVRDVVAGEHQIKLGCETYLPRFRSNQSDEEYERFRLTTPFFPATARTAQGRRGLMFAKNVVLKPPDCSRSVVLVQNVGREPFRNPGKPIPLTLSEITTTLAEFDLYLPDKRLFAPVQQLTWKACTDIGVIGAFLLRERPYGSAVRILEDHFATPVH